MCTPLHSRRDFMRSALMTAGVAGATVALPTALSALVADYPMPDTVRDPQSALASLYAGNKRFAGGNITAPNRNMARLKEVSAAQKPFAAFLGCADSRVPVEIVFDQGFGDVFVTRIAGTVADASIIGSLEFGTEVLGAQVRYVLGHTRCGAVAATIAGNDVPGQISTLYQHIRRAAKEAKGNLDLAIRRNVQIQAEILREASPVIARRITRGELVVAGGVYDLDTGIVSPVELD